MWNWVYIILFCIAGFSVVLLAYVYGCTQRRQPRKEIGNMLRRIIPENHPDLVSGLIGTYEGTRVSSIDIHKIIIDGEDVNIEVEICFDGAWGIHGTIQIELDDDNDFAEKLREIIELEEGND